MPSDPFDPATCLAESNWVHRLARRLAGEHAEDVAQEALLATWQRPPGSDTPRRAWLLGIVRHLARGQRREERRRRERERLHGLARACESDRNAVDIAARLEVHEQLIVAIRHLPEPARTTIALRFLDELPVAEIAARTGVPLKTVYSRLDRALAELRRRLDHRFGSRAAWCAPILARPGATTVPAAATTAAIATAATLAMGTSTKWIAAAALAAVLGLVATRTVASPGQSPTVDRAARPDPVTAPPTPVAFALPPDRQALPADEALTPADSPPPAPGPRLLGFVLDLEQRPVAGIPVRYEPIDLHDERRDSRQVTLPPPAVSGRDGSFSLPAYEVACRLAATDDEYATVFAPSLAGPLPPEPQFVFVGPIRRHAGTVVDEAGTPIARASIAVRLAPDLARRLPGAALGGQLPIAHAITDADGHFAVPPIGSAPDTVLLVHADGFADGTVVLPEVSTEDLRIALRRPAADPTGLRGQVTFADGRVAAGAHVAAGERVVACDADGRFTISPDSTSQAPERVVAVHRDHLPAWRDLAAGTAIDRGELNLVLGGDCRSIRGRVLAADGSPMAGARIWTPDGETFGKVPVRFGEVSILLDRSIETMMAGDDTGRDTRSDANGRFALRGLLDRDYRVFAATPDGLELIGPERVRAGAEDVQLVAVGGGLRSHVAGRVTSLAGSAIVGAIVQAERSIVLADGTRITVALAEAQARRTDADGRFRFDGLCIEGTRLLVKQDAGQMETTVTLAGHANLGDILIPLPQRCHLRVELSEPSSADSLSIEDANGASLSLQFEHGGMLFEANSVSFDLGGSEPLIVFEQAHTLVLRKDLDVVARLPLRLTPGELTKIRW